MPFTCQKCGYANQSYVDDVECWWCGWVRPKRKDRKSKVEKKGTAVFKWKYPPSD